MTSSIFDFSTNYSTSSDSNNDNSRQVIESKELNDVKDTQEKHEFVRLTLNEKSEHVLAEGPVLSSLIEPYYKTSSTTRTNKQRHITGSIATNNVFVTSLMGDTASGKSFLGNHLLGTNSYVFNENDHDDSTTANVTLFESDGSLTARGGNKWFVLDFEGENAMRLPFLLKYMRDYLPSTLMVDDRRDAVTKYFPPLAYLISDVIIFIGTDDLFTNSRYMERIMQFTDRACGNVQQRIRKPALILVQNKYGGEKVLTPEESTKKFYSKISRPEVLENFFSVVRCFILPFKRNQTTDNVNRYFDIQVDTLQKLLTKLCTHNQQKLLPEIPWLLLTRKVIEKLSEGEPIMMDTMLHNIFVGEQADAENSIILFLFRKLYEKRNIHSIQWFNHCRDFALDVLARSIAMRCSFVTFSSFTEFIKQECEKRLNELWKKIDEYRPCEALYMGRGYVKERNRPVFCYQHMAAHGKTHQTSEVVHGSSWWKALVEYVVQWPTIDMWNGSFDRKDASSNTPGQALCEKLVKTTNDFLIELKKDANSVTLTFRRLLHKWNVPIEPEELPN